MSVNKITQRGPEHPRLLQAAEAIAAAERNYQGILRQVQETCCHARVAEQEDGSYGADLSHHHARRICCDCGYEETRWASSRTHPWSGTNSADGKTSADQGAKLILTTDFVKRVPFSGSVLCYRPIVDAPSLTQGAKPDA